MKYLITGASGFVGIHLVNHIKETHPEASIFCVSRNHSSELESLKVTKQFTSNLGDRDSILAILNETKPDFIIHLASQSSVAQSWSDPSESFRNNTNIFLNLLEAIRHGKFLSTLLLSIGSSDQYGSSGSLFCPLRETDALSPLSPYAVARVAQEQLAQIYQRGYGLKIICTRSFNHLGSGQTDKFVISSFVKQAMEIKQKKKASLKCGNLDVVRDFIDVRDVVRAYDVLLHKGTVGKVYNICSGQGHSLKEVVELIQKTLKIKFEVEESKDLLRPIETPYIVGSPLQLKLDTGFKPQFTLENSILELSQYWEKRFEKA